MADDIDDLLDEVEGKYCAKGKSKTDPQKKKISITKSRRKLDDDIDDILTQDDDLPVIKSLQIDNRTKPSTKTTSKRPDSSRKCFPVFLGGSSQASGLASSVNKRSCDKLRCTSCDFKVCSFENFEWSDSTDYLFLRNNVPDYEKLKLNLRPKKGTRAYCCQCCWRSVRQLEEIRDSSLKWVCGRH